MEAVAIINMPNCCHNCVFADWDQCLCKLANEEFYSQENMDGRQKWCPLKPMPHKLQAEWYTDGYKEGFNACLDAITGETE